MQATEPKLLIADDDRDFRETLSEVFTRRGFSTELAADGREALEIVQSSSQLHLVLLDVHMPRLSGIEALGKIREMDEAALPCILMSAQFDEQIVETAQRLRIESLLSKPFTLRDLTGTVERIFARSYGWQL
ncbi:MAG: response regulator [Planctomycetota bacterium]